MCGISRKSMYTVHMDHIMNTCTCTWVYTCVHVYVKWTYAHAHAHMYMYMCTLYMWTCITCITYEHMYMYRYNSIFGITGEAYQDPLWILTTQVMNCVPLITHYPQHLTLHKLFIHPSPPQPATVHKAITCTLSYTRLIYLWIYIGQNLCTQTVPTHIPTSYMRYIHVYT